jgi:hypothetical protein
MWRVTQLRRLHTALNDGGHPTVELRLAILPAPQIMIEVEEMEAKVADRRDAFPARQWVRAR